MSHIPVLHTIPDFFRVYGLGQPLHSQIMCMHLEDQPDSKRMQMPLYRADFFRVIQFTEAPLTFTTQEQKVEVVGDCLYFTYPGKLESWERQGRLYGTVIYFSDTFLPMSTTQTGFDQEYPYFTFEGDGLLPLAQAEAALLKGKAEEMIQEMYAEYPDKLSMLQKLLSVYLHTIRRLYVAKMGGLSSESKASQRLFTLFRKASEQYFQLLAQGQEKQMPSVSLLAEQVGVSANYLNESIKSLTGKTASGHLQEKMLLEAKSYLLHSDLQVAQVAYRLGFENVPYFNRFFKKLTATTPVAFRQQHKS